MTIDWGQIITEVLVIVLPTIITALVSKAVHTWTVAKENEKYGEAMFFIDSMAIQFVKAAFQIGEKQGWDNATRRAYVLEQMKALAVRLNISVGNDDLERILDAILEGAYVSVKPFLPTKPSNDPVATGVEVTD